MTEPYPIARRFSLDGVLVDLDDLVDANREGLDPEEIEDLRALRPGESITFGGGAWATWTVECLPDGGSSC